VEWWRWTQQLQECSPPFQQFLPRRGAYWTSLRFISPWRFCCALVWSPRTGRRGLSDQMCTCEFDVILADLFLLLVGVEQQQSCPDAFLV
jgi:hypothetical protein